MSIFTVLTPAMQTGLAFIFLIVAPLGFWAYLAYNQRQSPRRSSPPAFDNERR